MGRKPTSIRFNSVVFRELFKDLNYANIAEGWGVTRQAVNGWLTTGRIPPRAMAEIIKAHDVDPKDVERLMDVPPDAEKKKPKKIFTIELNIYQHEE